MAPASSASNERTGGYGRARGLVRSLGAAASSLVLAAGVAQAQLSPGDTIRVALRHGDEMRGAFVRIDAEALHLRPFTSVDTVTLSTTDYVRSEVLIGRRRGGAGAIGRGAVRGLGVGLAAGAVSALFTPGHPSNERLGGRGLGVIVLTILGAGIGTIHGAAMGIVYEENWQPFGLVHDAPSVSTPASPTTLAAPAPTGMVMVGGRPQRWFQVAPDDTVRFAYHSQRIQGLLVRAEAGALGVRQLTRADTSIVPLDELAAPQVRRGRARLGARALGYGALAGAAIGITFGGLLTSHESVVSRAFIGAGSGTILGIPAMMIQRPRWMEFDPVSLRVR